MPKWCFWTVVLEKILESPLDSKEIKPINPKGIQLWIVIGKTDAEVEAPILWPPDVKSQLTGKDLYSGKDWGQEEKGKAEDEVVGWCHWLDGHEFEQAPGDREGQGSLVCCSSQGHKELDMIEWLKNDDNFKVQHKSQHSEGSLLLSCLGFQGEHYRPSCLTSECIPK